MNAIFDVLSAWASAFGRLWLQPFYYIGLLFVFIQYRRTIYLERKMFASRLHRLFDSLLATVLWGFGAGVAGSLVMAFVGATLQQEALLWLWGIALLLAIVRIRFFCLAYAAGIIACLHAAVSAWPSLTDLSGVGPAMQSLDDIQPAPLLALVAILHLIEAVLVRYQGARLASPLFIEGKRGKLVGAFQLLGFWPAPLFLLVPLAGGHSSALPWTPLFGGDLWTGGWTVIAFPVMIGFTELTKSRVPKQKVIASSNLLFVYSAAVLGFAALAHYVPALTVLAAIFTIGLHETIIWYSRMREEIQPPLYTHEARGLTVLAVLPGSAAAEMGIEPGEIIHKANGVKVHSKEELHQAIQLNPAFCKLEVLNQERQSKFVSRAMFAGEHHQLGIILSPDDRAPYAMVIDQPSLLGTVWTKFFGLQGRKPADPQQSGADLS